MKIAVVGLGYVGFSNAVLLAQNHDVTAFDINPSRVDQINRKETTVNDPFGQTILRERKLKLRASAQIEKAFEDAEEAPQYRDIFLP